MPGRRGPWRAARSDGNAAAYRGAVREAPCGCPVAGLDQPGRQPRYTAPSLRPVRWQSGDAADCKSANVGSIPARTSNSINGIGDVSNFHIRVCTFTFNRCRRMNRQEKARRVLEPRGQVFHVRDFGLVEVRFLSSDYAFEECDGTLTPTGRLDIFRLSARDPSLPGFLARWDGGNRYGREQFDLDIDMVNAGEDEIAKFRVIRMATRGHAVCTTDPRASPIRSHDHHTARRGIRRNVLIHAASASQRNCKAEARVWCDAQVVRASPES